MLVTRYHMIGESELLRTNFINSANANKKSRRLQKLCIARPRASGGCRCKMLSQT